MSIVEFKMKTHSRKDITDECGELNVCKVHNIQPRILEIVAGKRKETHYVAVCLSDECNKITTLSKEEIVKIWNKHNPIN